MVAEPAGHVADVLSPLGPVEFFGDPVPHCTESVRLVVPDHDPVTLTTPPLVVMGYVALAISATGPKDPGSTVVAIVGAV